MKYKLLVMSLIFAIAIFGIVGIIMKTHTVQNQQPMVIPQDYHNFGKPQTIFIDQAKHDAIVQDNSNTAESLYNTDNFVVTCTEPCSYLNISAMQCDDLARWWNSHNEKADNDEVWAEITKLGCQ